MPPFALDEDVEPCCPQVGITGGIDELQVEPIATMLRKLGGELRGNQNPLPAVGLDSMLDGGKRNRSVDGLDLHEKLERLFSYLDLDHGVRLVTPYGRRLASVDGGGQSRGAVQSRESVPQQDVQNANTSTEEAS